MTKKTLLKAFLPGIASRMKKIDPIYWFLRLILLKFLSVETKERQDFVLENLEKHRRVLWLDIIGGILVYFGVKSSGNVETVVLALIAPVTVMGAAWFAVSFGAIPKKLISEAMAITFWMFLGFTLSLMAMFVSVAYISPIILWPILLLIFLSAIISCIKYDTADGLKAGLDEAVLTHSRYAIEYYKKTGIKTED